ncbi:MAG: butyrate kinase, partial [Spirochaetales bacterium]|nr:butyrate kinase [Spirochaetales bacterium]
IEDLLKEYGYSLNDVDVFIGRGGCAYSQKSGVMEIDEKLYQDTRDDKGGSDHSAKLGVMLAYIFSKETNKRAYTVDPTNVDEYIPEARITGIKGVYKRAQSHVLNQKGIARLWCKEHGRNYENSRLIVSHIDGGITIAAHENGLMIDGTEGAGGDGPFTPTRLGSIPVLEAVRYAKNHSIEDVEAMCSRSGGFVSHFNTSNADTIHKAVEENDDHAKLVWNAMIYQIAKEIGAMAAVLEGRVDGILLTGGLVRFNDIVEGIKERCSFIAPIYVYKGEVEQEVLNSEVLKVLRGEIKANKYSGKPVFEGYSWDE